MKYPRNKKIIPLYTLDLFGKEYEGAADIPLYDIIQEKDIFRVRYYGCCAVKTTTTFEEAKAYIYERAAHLLNKEGNKK